MTIRQKYENAIRECLRATCKAGGMLVIIRDRELYINEYSSFEEYCVATFGCSRDWGDRAINHWRIDKIATPIGVNIENEYQARALIGLTDDQVKEALKYVPEIVGSGRLTHEHLRLAALRVRKPTSKRTAIPKKVKVSVEDLGHAISLVSKAKEELQKGDQEASLQTITEVTTFLVDLQTLTTRAIITNITATDSRAGQPAPAASALQVPCETVGVQAFTEDTKPATVMHNTSRQPQLRSAEVHKPEPGASPSEPIESIAGQKPMSERPVEVQVGSEAVAIRKWNEVPLIVGNWLIGHGVAIPDVSFVKQLASDFPASARLKTLANGALIELGDDRPNLLRKARRLLEESGRGEVAITVRLASEELVDV